MNIACLDETVVPAVRAVLQKFAVARVHQQGPNLGSPMMWLMTDARLGDDEDRALRRAVTQIPGATIRS